MSGTSGIPEPLLRLLQYFNIDSSQNLNLTGVGGTIVLRLAPTSIRQFLLVDESISGTLTTSQASLRSFTPPATAGRYRVGGAITHTSATNTGTTALRLSYVDSQGSTHTSDILPLTGAAGTVVQSSTGASVERGVLEREITIDNSATAIVFDSAVTGTSSATIATYIYQVA